MNSLHETWESIITGEMKLITFRLLETPQISLFDNTKI